MKAKFCSYSEKLPSKMPALLGLSMEYGMNHMKLLWLKIIKMRCFLGCTNPCLHPSSSHHLLTTVFFPFETTVMRLVDGLSVN